MNLLGTRFRLNDQATWHKEYRLFLELMFVFLIIALLASAFLEKTPSFIEKTRLISLMAPASEGRFKVIEHHAFSGNWLNEAEVGNEYFLSNRFHHENTDIISTQISHIQQGAVHIEVRNRKRNDPAAAPEQWSIRPAVIGGDTPTVLWVCGSRSPPAGFRTLGENLTTIPPEVNFRFCQ
jgi:hypothetical protein